MVILRGDRGWTQSPSWGEGAAPQGGWQGSLGSGGERRGEVGARTAQGEEGLPSRTEHWDREGTFSPHVGWRCSSRTPVQIEWLWEQQKGQQHGCDCACRGRQRVDGEGCALGWWIPSGMLRRLAGSWGLGLEPELHGALMISRQGWRFGGRGAQGLWGAASATVTLPSTKPHTCGCRTPRHPMTWSSQNLRV